MGYANPLFDLPAARQLLALPKAQRLSLAKVFREIRAEANAKAIDLWESRLNAAGGMRAVATYARHFAHLLEQKVPLTGPVSLLPDVPDYAGHHSVYTTMCPLEFKYTKFTDTFAKLLWRTEEEREALIAMFNEIRVIAFIKSETSWAQKKGPMAVYWRHVEDTANAIVHELRIPSRMPSNCTEEQREECKEYWARARAEEKKSASAALA